MSLLIRILRFQSFDKIWLNQKGSRGIKKRKSMTIVHTQGHKLSQIEGIHFHPRKKFFFYSQENIPFKN